MLTLLALIIIEAKIPNPGRGVGKGGFEVVEAVVLGIGGLVVVSGIRVAAVDVMCADVVLSLV